MKPVVGIIMGSDSDLSVMQEAAAVLKEFRVPYELKILSAHRTPEATGRYAKGAVRNGLKVIIAGAGRAAHLAGVIASHTTLPVIGVPLESKALKGLDALLSTVQMPRGVPVATMAIGNSGAANAALFALKILGITDRKIKNKLIAYRKGLVSSVRKKNKALLQL